MGNNGGDALAAARLLHKSGYNVTVSVVEYSEKYTEDCEHNLRRVRAENITCKKVISEKDIPDIKRYDVVIDGIFGTGLSREVDGIAAKVIQHINDSDKPVISIDVPSGMFLDRKTLYAIQAKNTITFQIPKLALYLPENQNYAGDVSIVGIGLNEQAIEEAESNIFLY